MEIYFLDIEHLQGYINCSILFNIDLLIWDLHLCLIHINAQQVLTSAILNRLGI